MKSKNKVLVIGWDAADWKMIEPLIESGEMPTLKKFMEDGVHGNIATLEPALSPMLWTSIATGKLPEKHGVLGFTEPNDAGAVVPVRSTSRKVKALWNIMTQNDKKSNVVAWWPTNPAEPIKGNMVSNLFMKPTGTIEEPWTMAPGTVHPMSIEETIAQLRVHPVELTEQHILPFIPNVGEVDINTDKRPFTLAKTLAATASVHNAATHLMENEPWDFMGVYYDGIDHFSHMFMKYHPPKHWDDMPEEEFNMYKDVMRGAYKFHDMMLERLLELAGEDTTVILLSDHGFHSDHLRPKYIPKEPAGPAYEHRPYGIFCMKGPGIKKGEKVFGTSLLDITPTVLSVFDLPIGKDMDGKVIMDAFEEEKKIEFIESWEQVEGEAGMHPEDLQEDPWEAQEALKQLVDLGYIEDPGEDMQEAAESSVRESQYNLARSMMSTGSAEKALVMFEKLYKENPKELRFARQLLMCLDSLSQYDRLREISEQTRVRFKKSLPSLRFFEGKALIAEKRYRAALDVFLDLTEKQPGYPGINIKLGEVYLHLDMYDKAIESYSNALEIDGENIQGLYGMGCVFIKQKKYEDAIEILLKAIETMYHNPACHFRLGEALALSGEKEYALSAFGIALKMAPGMKSAEQWISKLNRELGTENQDSEDPMVLVSGLPRSGTSMMMQMLDAGGAEMLIDQERLADTNNPKGYFEYEPVKKLNEESEWLKDEHGKVLKVVAQLIRSIPQENTYKVIFMERNLDEVLKSQQKMIGSTDSEKEAFPITLYKTFEKQVSKIKAWINRQPNVEVLYLNYTDVIQDPDLVARQVNKFTGLELDINQMAMAVDRKLYRNNNPVWN